MNPLSQIRTNSIHMAISYENLSHLSDEVFIEKLSELTLSFFKNFSNSFVKNFAGLKVRFSSSQKERSRINYRLLLKNISNLTLELFQGSHPQINTNRNDFSSSCPISSRIVNPYRESILNSTEYGDLMKNEEMLFHGINLAIWKIPSILEWGILSKKVAEGQGLSLGFNYGHATEFGISNGFNGELFISCARSPVHIDAVGDLYGAFGIFIQNGVSFAIRGEELTEVHNKPELCDKLPSGEAMVAGCISPDSIVGLVVPETLVDKKITEINFLQGGALGTQGCPIKIPALR